MAQASLRWQASGCATGKPGSSKGPLSGKRHILLAPQVAGKCRWIVHH